MSVTLREMTAEEFEVFRRYSIEHQAAEIAAAEQLPPEKALSEAEKEFSEMLPEGAATADNHLFAVVRTADGADVGAIWYLEEMCEGVKQAFVCDFVIREPYRRTGCGSAALCRAELDATERGCAECALFVANDNPPATALYEKMRLCLSKGAQLRQIYEENAVKRRGKGH